MKSIGFLFITDKTMRQLFLKDTFHNLKSIYEYILRHTSFPRNPAEHTWLVEYFENVSKTDKASDSFRYPFHILPNYDEVGMLTFEIKRIFQKQTHLDLISEANKFEAAYEILNAWYLDMKDPSLTHEASEYIECDNSFLDEGGYYYTQSVVGYEYRHDDFYAYCSGYRECASYLLNWLKRQLVGQINTQFIGCTGFQIHDNVTFTRCPQGQGGTVNIREVLVGLILNHNVLSVEE